MNYGETLIHEIAEPTMKLMVTKYSEQLVFQPVNEIRHWFTYESVTSSRDTLRSITVGKRTSPSPRTSLLLRRSERPSQGSYPRGYTGAGNCRGRTTTTQTS